MYIIAPPRRWALLPGTDVEMSLNRAEIKGAARFVVGSNIRRYRVLAGLSQVDLAALLCMRVRATVTRHEVCRWEAGRRFPGEWIEHIAKILDVSVGDLCPWEVDRISTPAAVLAYRRRRG